MVIPHESDTPSSQEKPVFPVEKNFLEMGAEADQHFLEAVNRTGSKKVIIAVHPYFLEENRLPPYSKPSVKRYNRSRYQYIRKAAQCGWPVIIFEEANVLNDAKEWSNRYAEVLPYPQVVFVKTLQADPTPTSPESEAAYNLYEKIYDRFVHYDKWSEEDWNTLHSVIAAAGLPRVEVDLDDIIFNPQYMYLWNVFVQASDILRNRSLQSFAQKLDTFGVNRIAIGGSKYHTFTVGSGNETGCVSYLAAELHRRGFRVGVSNYFVYPERPTLAEKTYLRE